MFIDSSHEESKSIFSGTKIGIKKLLMNWGFGKLSWNATIWTTSSMKCVLQKQFRCLLTKTILWLSNQTFMMKKKSNGFCKAAGKASILLTSTLVSFFKRTKKSKRLVLADFHIEEHFNHEFQEPTSNLCGLYCNTLVHCVLIAFSVFFLQIQKSNYTVSWSFFPNFNDFIIISSNFYSKNIQYQKKFETSHLLKPYQPSSNSIDFSLLNAPS